MMHEKKVIDADMTSQIYDGKAQLDQNRDLLLGEHYNRMIVSTDFPTEGSNTFADMEEIQNAAESRYRKATWLAIPLWHMK